MRKIEPREGHLFQDVRYSLRALRQNPGFTSAAVLTLALGIGANTAIFSVVDAFLLRPLPVKAPHRLAVVRHIDAEGRSHGDFPYPIFEQLRDRNHSFAGIFAYDDTHVSATAAGQPEYMDGDFVSGSYFDVLGVKAALGRTLTADDDRPGRPPAAVISDRYWRRRFASDPAAIGRTIYLGGIAFQVVGVTSPRFFGRRAAGKSADVVLPMAFQARLGLKDHDTFGIMARLKPGVTLEQAGADLDVVYHQALAQAADPRRRAERIRLAPGRRGDSDDPAGLRRELWILMAVVGIALLAAATNVANLLLARAAARQKEMSVRLALGAGRARLIRQLLTESVMLALCGGALGLLFADWGVSALMFVLSYGREPIPFELNPDARVLAFTAGVALLTGILFGLAPALAASRADLNAILKEGAEAVASRPARRRLAGSLVISQVALSVVLLAGAGLLLRSLRQLYRVDTGFERDHVVMAWVLPALNGYDHAREMELYRELYEGMNAVPGVQSASLARLRLIFSRWNRDIRVQGSAPAVTPQAYCNAVGPRYFETMGIPLLLGRELSPADTETAPKVAVISQSAARTFFPNTNPIGRRFGFDGPASSGGVEVVGVVRDIRRHLRETGAREAVYIPYTQAPLEELGQMNIVARTPNPAGIVPALRRQAQAIDKDLPLIGVETQEEEIDEYLAGERSLATLLSFFGGLALLLAWIGLYGTISYTVGLRTRELGIRMALGARRPDILGMVLRQALRQVAWGIAIGIPAACAAARLAANLLFGISAADPVAIAAAVVAMCTAALAAAWWPAHRATQVDPVAALR